MTSTDSSLPLTEAFSSLHLPVTNAGLCTPPNCHTPPPTSNMNTRASSSTVLSTNFASHLRASFKRAPTDHTGELVRLLDDIATVTHCISAFVAHDATAASLTPSSLAIPESLPLSTVTSLSSSTDSPTDSPLQCESPIEPKAPLLGSKVATYHLYKSLCHDGYACLILDSNTALPLTFPDDALQGLYIVTLTALQATTDVDDILHATCATSFSVYKRLSSPSLPGKLIDLQQNLHEQVAAGYVIYSSHTSLVYTFCDNVFSFYLHPVACQYFLNPSAPLCIPENAMNNSGRMNLFIDYSNLLTRVRQKDHLAECILKFINGKGLSNVHITYGGCFIADFHQAMKAGAVIVEFKVHLLCVAGGTALITEQMGGKAINGKGERILGLRVDDDDVHKTTSFLAGPTRLIDEMRACGFN